QSRDQCPPSDLDDRQAVAGITVPRRLDIAEDRTRTRGGKATEENLGPTVGVQAEIGDVRAGGVPLAGSPRDRRHRRASVARGSSGLLGECGRTTQRCSHAPRRRAVHLAQPRLRRLGLRLTDPELLLTVWSGRVLEAVGRLDGCGALGRPELQESPVVEVLAELLQLV